MTLPEFEVRRLSTALGAEVGGIDLREALTDARFEALRALLHEHQVLFFRDQDITAAQHKALASRFGPLQTHPAYPTVEGHPEVTILHHTREKPSRIEVWHTDMTFRPRPPLGSILRAKIMPQVGGDTLWASMSAAYEGLSDRMQRFLDGLTAVHSFAHGFKESLAEPGGYERLKGALSDNPPVEHPVIRTHPETGRKGIFVNALFTTHIKELSLPESRAVLEMLWDHAVRPEVTVRFKWRRDSIAFWDNRITQHVPINDYWPQERCMHRVVIDGDAPR